MLHVIYTATFCNKTLIVKVDADRYDAQSPSYSIALFIKMISTQYVFSIRLGDYMYELGTDHYMQTNARMLLQ